MDLKRRATRGAFWATIEIWSNEALQFLMFAILARLLGPQVYGLLGLALIVVLISQTTLAGWIEALIQRPEIEPLHLDTVFWSVLGLATALAGLAVLAAPLFAWFFGSPELAKLVPWLALTMPLTSLNIVPMALLQRGLRFAPLALRPMLGVTIAGVAAIGMALLDWGVWSLVAYQLIQPTAAALIFWSAVRWWPRLRFSRRHFCEIFTFSSKLAGERAVALGENLVPRIAVGWALDPVAVGLWTLARKIFDFSVELVQRPVMRVAMTTFSVAQTDVGRLMPMLVMSLELTALAAVPGYCALLLLAPDLLRVAFGESWVGSGAILRILAVVGFITPAERLLNTLMLALGRTGLSFAAATGAFVILIAGMLALAPWGLVGIAAAYALRTAVLLIARIVLLQRLLGRSLYPAAKGVLPVLGAGSVMLTVMMVLGGVLSDVAPPLRVAALLLAGGLGYLAALTVVARPLIGRLFGLVRIGLGGSKAATVPPD
jgi:O-antigen/teichoic acid export membrane protein